MAQPVSFTSVPRTSRHHNFSFLQRKGSGAILLQLGAFLAAVATNAQAPQQQYVYGGVPITTSTSQITAYAKNGQSGALSAVSGSPFADQQVGGAMAVDALGRFLFVVNPSSSNISMFQINQHAADGQWHRSAARCNPNARESDLRSYRTRSHKSNANNHSDQRRHRHPAHFISPSERCQPERL
jgi:6-phosphogluconolactonase (cycloisomerase 2 family)